MKKLTDEQCRHILSGYPGVPRTEEVFAMIRYVFKAGRDSNVMKVAYKNSKETK